MRVVCGIQGSPLSLKVQHWSQLPKLSQTQPKPSISCPPHPPNPKTRSHPHLPPISAPQPKKKQNTSARTWGDLWMAMQLLDRTSVTCLHLTGPPPTSTPPLPPVLPFQAAGPPLCPRARCCGAAPAPAAGRTRPGPRGPRDGPRRRRRGRWDPRFRGKPEKSQRETCQHPARRAHAG